MSTAKFIPAPPTTTSQPHSHAHDHDHSHDHSHAHDHHSTPISNNTNSGLSQAAIEHGHAHEIMEHAGKFTERDLPDYSMRNWEERAFTIGIGG